MTRLALAALLLASTPALADATGAASWYSQGHVTASGERYDRHDLTAASRTLPFGTRVLVSRMDDHRHVIVRINDRGPFKRGRVIDLSQAAGERLGIGKCGVARVRIQVLR